MDNSAGDSGSGPTGGPGGDAADAPGAGRDGWEQIATGVARRRLPFLDVTVGVVVGTAGVLVVDSGSTLREGARVRAEVRKLTGRPVSHVALTHGHFDHVFGAAALGRATVHAAAPLAERLVIGRADLRADAVRHGVDRRAADRAVAALATPEVAVEDRLTLDLGGREVVLTVAGPGHTDHDLAVLVPGTPAVVFCGDLVEESGAPQAGTDALPERWPAALDRLLALGGETARYVPGHGATVDARFVREQRDALARRARGG